MKTLILSLLMTSVLAVSAGNGEKNSKTKAKDRDVHKNFLSITGECFRYSGKLKNVTVHVYLENELVNVLETQRKGQFSLVLSKNSYYTLEFIKEGFLTKRMSFFTEAPDKVSNVEPFEFSIELLPESNFEGVDSDVLDFPAALIRYDAEKNEFEYDKKYTKDIIIEQELLMYESYMKQSITLQ